MKVLITDPMPADFIAELKKHGLEVVQVRTPPPEVLKEVVRGYDAIVVRSATKVTAEVIMAADALRVIARAGAGLDNIDVEAATRRGIKVINVPEAVANAVAELTIGLAFSLLRSIPQAVESLKSGRWEKGAFIGRELSGMRVGVVGLGTIGSLVARKMVALGAHVVAYRRNRELLMREAASIGAEPATDLEELLKTCELVTLHVPYTAETHYLLNERNLRLMSRGSFLINTSRAWVVDGKALLRALNEGILEGVAADVHYNEPPREDWEWELIKHPKVIATPHIGAQTREAGARVSRLLADRLLAALKGE
ncbi:MAG: hydroxyacid dehydrogenase [Thermofilaceae archaeon]